MPPVQHEEVCTPSSHDGCRAHAYHHGSPGSLCGGSSTHAQGSPASAQLVCQGPNSWVLYVNEPVRVHLGLVLLWGSTSSSVAHPKATVSNLLAPRTGFMKEYFLWMGSRGWFQDDSSTVYLLCTLFLLVLQQLHLRSSGIRYWKLTTRILDTGS